VVGLLFYKTAADDWVFEELKANQVPEPVPQNDVPLETYLTVTLKSMRVVNVRRGLTKFYGVVHSFAAVPHASGDMAQFNKVVSPNQLKELDAAHVDPRHPGGPAAGRSDTVSRW